VKNLKLKPEYQRAFTPKVAWDLASLIEKQAIHVYEQLGIVIPVVTSSSLCFIGQQKKVSLLEIARALDIPHQLAAQRIKILLKLDLILANKDPSDKRRTNYMLTIKGHEQNALLTEYLGHAEKIFNGLNEELNTDLMKILEQTKKSFVERTLHQRIFKEEE
jgi:DNA-binding MarR family transcriptional regulator